MVRRPGSLDKRAAAEQPAYSTGGSNVNSLMLLASAAAAAAVPPVVAVPVPMSLPVKHDVQCFLLYAVAVDNADTAKDDKVKQGSSLAVMYFFAKLKVEAPALDLAQAVRQEANSFETDPNLKETGAACDSEFQKRGNELINLGNELQRLAPQSSSSS
jgi:hypothetical protein